MTRVVDGRDADEAVCVEVEAGDAAVGGSNPDGAQGRSVERAHQVEGENADGSGVGEDGDRFIPVLFDNAVGCAPRAVEQLSIAFAAGQDVCKIASQQSRILIGKTFRRFLKRQAFHVPDAAFTKRIFGLNCHAGRTRERLRRLDSAQKVARINRRDAFRLKLARGGFRLPLAALRERRRRMAAETTLGVALRLTVTDKQDGGLHNLKTENQKRRSEDHKREHR